MTQMSFNLYIFLFFYWFIKMVHFYLYPILMGMAGGEDGELWIKKPWPYGTIPSNSPKLSIAPIWYALRKNGSWLHIIKHNSNQIIRAMMSPALISITLSLESFWVTIISLINLHVFFFRFFNKVLYLRAESRLLPAWWIPHVHINGLVGAGVDIVLIDVKDGLELYMECWMRGNKLRRFKVLASMRGADIICWLFHWVSEMKHNLIKYFSNSRRENLLDRHND